MLSVPGREINLCFKWDWNPGHFDFLSIALTNRWSTCNPLLYTLFYLNLHYSTMALLHFYSTSLYHDSILLYLTVHHSIMALDHSSSLRVPWLYWILFYCLHVCRDHRNVARHCVCLVTTAFCFMIAMGLVNCIIWFRTCKYSMWCRSFSAFSMASIQSTHSYRANRLVFQNFALKKKMTT